MSGQSLPNRMNRCYPDAIQFGGEAGELPPRPRWLLRARRNATAIEEASMDAKKILVLCILLLGALAFHRFGSARWAPVAQAGPGCNRADLRGTYSFVIHGNNPLGQPFGAIGTLTADGAGNIDGIRVSLDNGEYSTADFTCTYSMHPACLFRGPCVDDGEVVAEVQIDGALADGKREIELLVSRLPDVAGGAVVTGSARRQ
jgi:hypothetical protein